MTPRQLRLIHPLTRQPRAKALGHRIAAYLIWPLCLFEQAIVGYCETVVEKLARPHPRSVSPTLPKEKS